MKKVGIVTWYKNGNFGGTLQAYAMSKVLNNMGLETVFLNHYCGNRIVRFCKDICFSILYPKSSKSRKSIYSFVKNTLKESPRLRSMEQFSEYSRGLDVVLCGSDQIWNSKTGADPVFFLQFAPVEKRLAYAPSIGVPVVADEHMDQFVSFVSSFHFLSVREKQAAEFIKKNALVEAKVVLDPTLLIKREELVALASDEVVKKNKIKEKEYILCYFLGNDERYCRFVNRMIERTGYPVYFVSSKKKNYKERQLSCGPLELLGLLKHAAYVLTDSFHGLVLSCNIGTPVACFKRFSDNERYNENSRIYSVIELLNLKALVSTDENSVEEFLKLDFEENDKIMQNSLELLREESMSYLKNGLECILEGVSNNE